MKRKIIVGAIILSGMGIGLFGLHFYLADKSVPEQLTATVVRKYTKTRHHTRRVNHRVSVAGRPYNVYFFKLELEDGTTKDIEVQVQRYNRTRYGSTIDVTRRKGLFGIPVIRIEKLSHNSKDTYEPVQ